jgi:hypothetical protein
MKATITLLALTCFLLTGFGQVYQPFPTSSALWRESSNGFQCSCCSEYQYTITGDTVINTLTYHKLQKTGVAYQENWNGNCTTNIAYSINQYVGSFINDSANKLINFIYPSESADSILYNFNLAIGDTVPPSPLNEHGNIVNIVTAIDSVYLGNVYHKRFKLDDCSFEPQQLYYIEGIGSTYGLLSPTSCPFEAIYTLECFTIASQSVYPNSGASCSMITAGDDILSANQFSIFPNPTNGLVKIESNLQMFSISVFNSLGLLVHQKNVNSNTFSLDLSYLPTGLYIIEFSSNEKQLYRQTLIRQ